MRSIDEMASSNPSSSDGGHRGPAGGSIIPSFIGEELDPLLGDHAFQSGEMDAFTRSSESGPNVLKDDMVVGIIAGEDVRQAIQNEHELSFVEALRQYPTAVGWSVFFSLGVIMTAFDPQLMGNLYATPAFQRDFGYLYNDEYIISAPWQTALGMGNPIGQVVGAFAASYPMEWYGRKKTFGVCVVLTAAFIFIQFFARSLKVLLVGELLGGLVLGTYAVIAPAYASEVCPVALRGVLTSYINLCFVMGQLVANGLMNGTSKLHSHWAYSAPFATQWIWPLIILIGLPFAPESPWWLVRRGRIEHAERALRRLSSPTVDVKPTLAMIIETNSWNRSSKLDQRTVTASNVSTSAAQRSPWEYTASKSSLASTSWATRRTSSNSPVCRPPKRSKCRLDSSVWASWELCSLGFSSFATGGG
ncbi:hypothetical protein TI39_contig48g00013 [Zymoseptoria brevis]|uniref:Major facilitator superfamily (MFS) profile domain-containing protein n=1 Tax=Zymoseptoria brevis TaxID=1047168 RepID=A0A0F4GZ27_9PEZI|nr:hypothetical protein TI39_contig48g00013 [Zymoseptoria brevis]